MISSISGTGPNAAASSRVSEVIARIQQAVQIREQAHMARVSLTSYAAGLVAQLVHRQAQNVNGTDVWEA